MVNVFLVGEYSHFFDLENMISTRTKDLGEGGQQQKYLVIRKLFEIARCWCFGGRGIYNNLSFFPSFIFFSDANPKSIAIKRKKGQGGSTYSRLTNQVENLTMVGYTHLFLFLLRVGRGGKG